MGCCTSIIKYLLFGFNILFWLAGGVLLGVGIWLRVDPQINNVFTVAGTSIYAGAIGFIVFGSIVFVVGFFGCCGAIKENKCLLGTYFGFVLVIFAAEVGVGIWAFVSQSTIHTTIENSLNGVTPVDPNKDKEFTDALKYVQQTFKCCGLMHNCTDWLGSNATGCSCATTDTNCVMPSTLQCTNADTASSRIYKTDCYDAIVKFINDNIGIIAGIAIGIAVAEIFLMICALIMCNSAGKSGYETY